MQIPSLAQSEAHQYMLELGELRKAVSKDKGKELFERWVTWFAGCDQEKDPHGYGASADTIFNVLELLQKLISVEEMQDMGGRLLAIIKVEDDDHRDFLERKRKALFLK